MEFADAQLILCIVCAMFALLRCYVLHKVFYFIYALKHIGQRRI